MGKLDVGKLARKLDHLVGNVKTIVSPGSVIPEDAADKMTTIMHALSSKLEEAVDDHAKQTKLLEEIHIHLGQLFKELQVLQAKHEQESTVAPSAEQHNDQAPESVGEKPVQEEKPKEEKENKT